MQFASVRTFPTSASFEVMMCREISGYRKAESKLSRGLAFEVLRSQWIAEEIVSFLEFVTKEMEVFFIKYCWKCIYKG